MCVSGSLTWNRTQGLGPSTLQIKPSTGNSPKRNPKVTTCFVHFFLLIKLPESRREKINILLQGPSVSRVHRNRSGAQKAKTKCKMSGSSKYYTNPLLICLSGPLLPQTVMSVRQKVSSRTKRLRVGLDSASTSLIQG